MDFFALIAGIGDLSQVMLRSSDDGGDPGTVLASQEFTGGAMGVLGGDDI